MPDIMLSAPSMLLPDAIPGNVRALHRLAGTGSPVRDVGLCFFEAQACLEYTEEDLPTWLADTGFTYHVHLPLDPDWESGPAHVAHVACRLADKVEFLSPWGFVLHPPKHGPEAHGLLAGFAAAWRAAGRNLGDVLVENIDINGLEGTLPVQRGDGAGTLLDAVVGMGFGICVDVGHVLAFGQQAVVERLEILRDSTGTRPVRLAHLYDPGHDYSPETENTHRHAAMNAMEKPALDMAARIMGLLADDGRAMIEVFDFDAYTDSLPELDAIAADAGFSLRPA